MEGVQKGDLKTRFPIDNKDEIGKLSQVFH